MAFTNWAAMDPRRRMWYKRGIGAVIGVAAIVTLGYSGCSNKASASSILNGFGSKAGFLKYVESCEGKILPKTQVYEHPTGRRLSFYQENPNSILLSMNLEGKCKNNSLLSEFMDYCKMQKAPDGYIYNINTARHVDLDAKHIGEIHVHREKSSAMVLSLAPDLECNVVAQDPNNMLKP
jgi:hypothetical protein